MVERKDRISRAQQILAAARQVFAVNGFYETRVEDIAQAARVGKGTVYEYFSSKEELYGKMLLELADSYFAGLAQELSREVRLEDKLLGIARHHFQFLEEHGGLARMVIQDPGPVPLEFHRRLVQVRRGVNTQVAGLVEEAVELGRFRPVNPEVAAQFFLGGLAAAAFPGIIEGEAISPDALKTVVEMFLRGVVQEK